MNILNTINWPNNGYWKSLEGNKHVSRMTESHMKNARKYCSDKMTEISNRLTMEDKVDIDDVRMIPKLEYFTNWYQAFDLQLKYLEETKSTGEIIRDMITLLISGLQDVSGILFSEKSKQDFSHIHRMDTYVKMIYTVILENPLDSKLPLIHIEMYSHKTRGLYFKIGIDSQPPRTKENVINDDLTLAFGNKPSKIERHESNVPTYKIELSYHHFELFEDMVFYQNFFKSLIGIYNNTIELLTPKS